MAYNVYDHHALLQQAQTFSRAKETRSSDRRAKVQ
jgi:hypothetical protein